MIVCLNQKITFLQKMWYSFVVINGTVTLGNLLILLVIMYKNQKQRTISNILTLHLIFTRVGFSVIGQSLRVFSNYCRSFSYIDCYITVCTIKLFIYEGSMCIILIAIERYIKITKIRLYNKYFIKKNIIFMILVTWLISIGFPFFFEPKLTYIFNISPEIFINYCKFSIIHSKIFPLFSIFFILLLPPIVMGVFYYLLYKYISRQILMNVASNATLNTPSKLKSETMKRADIKNQKNFNFQIKTAFHAMTMCSIYVLFLYPVFLVTFMDNLFNSFKKENRIKFPPVTFQITYILQTIYPMIESSLCLYLNANIREHFSNLFSSFTTQNNSDSFNSNNFSYKQSNKI